MHGFYTDIGLLLILRVKACAQTCNLLCVSGLRKPMSHSLSNDLVKNVQLHIIIRSTGTTCTMLKHTGRTRLFEAGGRTNGTDVEQGVDGRNT